MLQTGRVYLLLFAVPPTEIEICFQLLCNQLCIYGQTRLGFRLGLHSKLLSSLGPNTSGPLPSEWALLLFMWAPLRSSDLKSSSVDYIIKFELSTLLTCSSCCSNWVHWPRTSSITWSIVDKSRDDSFVFWRVTCSCLSLWRIVSSFWKISSLPSLSGPPCVVVRETPSTPPTFIWCLVGTALWTYPSGHSLFGTRSVYSIRKTY